MSIVIYLQVTAIVPLACQSTGSTLLHGHKLPVIMHDFACMVRSYWIALLKPFPSNPIVLCLLIRFVYCQSFYCQPPLRHEPLAFLYAENLFYLCLY